MLLLSVEDTPRWTDTRFIDWPSDGCLRNKSRPVAEPSHAREHFLWMPNRKWCNSSRRCDMPSFGVIATEWNVLPWERKGRELLIDSERERERERKKTLLIDRILLLPSDRRLSSCRSTIRIAHSQSSDGTFPYTTLEKRVAFFSRQQSICQFLLSRRRCLTLKRDFSSFESDTQPIRWLLSDIPRGIASERRGVSAQSENAKARISGVGVHPFLCSKCILINDTSLTWSSIAEEQRAADGYETDELKNVLRCVLSLLFFFFQWKWANNHPDNSQLSVMAPYIFISLRIADSCVLRGISKGDRCSISLCMYRSICWW